MATIQACVEYNSLKIRQGDAMMKKFYLKRTSLPETTQNNTQRNGETTTVGERVADAIAKFGGSWGFIGIFLAVLVIWMALNVTHLFGVKFDPYPLHSPQPVPELFSSYPGTNHHDEPEPGGQTGPRSRSERLPDQPTGWTKN